jgi:hypothetical protein
MPARRRKNGPASRAAASSRRSVTTMSDMVTRFLNAKRAAPGRENSRPGRHQRRVSRLSFNGGWLLFITDQSSRRRFLIDTGSSFSIIPHHSSAPATGPALRSANNARIQCQPLQYQFLLADIRFPILGIDFLRHYKLMVDVCAEQLLPRTALAQTVGGDVFAVQQQACLPEAGSSEWDSILAEYPGVSQPFSVATNPAHGVEHTIKTSSNGLPIIQGSAGGGGRLAAAGGYLFRGHAAARDATVSPPHF